MKKLTIIFAILVSLAACKKEPDSPPENILDASKAITIDSLRKWQQSVSPNGISITDSLHLFAIVTMDEVEGNLYKNLYIQDHTAGVNMRMTSASSFAVGDSLRISLFGAYLSEYSGVIQLDSIDPDNMIVRQSSDNLMAPAVKLLNEITPADEGMLIQINNVQFTAPELSNTYADALNQSSQNRILEDCFGNTVIVRTSGFANYAGQTVKQGNGNMTAIVNVFGTDIQLYIRSLEELTLNNARCPGQLILKDFDDDDITSGGWTSVQVEGPSVIWTTSTAGGAPNPYAVITNWTGSANTLTENWLISPSMDLTSGGASLQFRNAYKFSGAPLELLISTDYTGSGNPNSSTWVDLGGSVNWSAGDFVWANSGIIDLSAYNQSSVYVAFKYTGSASSGSTWEIDDIVVVG